MQGGLIEPPKPIEETFWWQFFHAVFFLIGGFTFIFGTAVYYFPKSGRTPRVRTTAC